LKTPPGKNLSTPLLALAACLACACQSTEQKNSPAENPPTILFEDPMTGDWRDNWFLDGEKAVLEQDENGLRITAATLPGIWEKRKESPEQRELFDSLHTVLWTKEEFEGEIGVSFEMTRNSEGFTFLLYMLAQGIGTPPYAEDLTEWNDLRKISRMDLYFGKMNLTGVTFRDQIRLRQYPWMDDEGREYTDNLIGEMLDYDGIPVGKNYKVDLELRAETLRIRLEEIGNPDNVLDRTFSRTDGRDPRRPAPSTRGRIGIRHMTGTEVAYWNFRIRRL
jgi:hypothetical protein